MDRPAVEYLRARYENLITEEVVVTYEELLGDFQDDFNLVRPLVERCMAYEDEIARLSSFLEAKHDPGCERCGKALPDLCGRCLDATTQETLAVIRGKRRSGHIRIRLDEYAGQ